MKMRKFAIIAVVMAISGFVTFAIGNSSGDVVARIFIVCGASVFSTIVLNTMLDKTH